MNYLTWRQQQEFCFGVLWAAARPDQVIIITSHSSHVQQWFQMRNDLVWLSSNFVHLSTKNAVGQNRETSLEGNSLVFTVSKEMIICHEMGEEHLSKKIWKLAIACGFVCLKCTVNLDRDRKIVHTLHNFWKIWTHCAGTVSKVF